MVFGSQHQPANCIYERSVAAKSSQPLLRQFGAPFFIICRVCIVDGVMKPDRQFNCLRVRGQGFDLVKHTQAISNVMLVVIMALRLGI